MYMYLNSIWKLEYNILMNASKNIDGLNPFLFIV